MNLFWIFITGLTTGGLACLAVQGGLLASVVANQKEQEAGDKSLVKNFTTFDKRDWWPVTMFLVTKLAAHAVLGFLLGAVGSVLTLSLGVRLTFQTITALFMLATAMNLLDAHPIFRYVVFQPPKFLTRLVRSTSQSRMLFAPAILGLMTIFIPCGVTQAMEVTAINSGNPVAGAMIMSAFVLGTMPLFAIIGVATARLSEKWQGTFSKVAAAILIALAVYSLNGVGIVLGSPVTVQKIIRPVTYFFSAQRFTAAGQPTTLKNGLQSITIKVLNSGYSPRRFQVAAGTPVELTLETRDTYSCAISFIMKDFNIKTFLAPTDKQTFVFTPQEKGEYTYTCSMGMYTGVMEVI